jgi:ribosomal subunit interface protein
MKYTYTYKNVKNSEALNTYIKDVFDKFEDYFNREVNCHASISKIGDNDLTKTVEITIRSGRQTFRATSTSDSFHKSVDETYDKIKKQIRRNKDKTLAKKRNGKIEVRLHDTKEDENNIFIDVITDGDNEYTIEKKKVIEPKPMSIPEAIIQLNEKGYIFFPFVNTATDDVTIIYKTTNGYGILER